MSGVPEWKARPEGPEYEATRQRLVDAAEAIVRDQGAAALRLDSVADAVGLHRSSVYRYVDSKEDLLTAVVVQVTLRVGRAVIDRIGESAPPERLLVEGLAMALAALTNEPVHRSLMDPSGSEAMTRLGGRALAEGLRPLVEPFFHAAVDRDLLRPGVTLEDATWWLRVVSSGLFRAPDALPEPEELTRRLELLLVPSLLDVTRSQESAGSS